MVQPLRPPRPRWLVPAVVAVAVVLVVALVVIVVVSGGGTSIAQPKCTVTAPANSPGLPPSYTATVDQIDNAATIAGVGRRLGVPDRAITVALATAVQESGLANLRGGDRDSLGLFQQRPSQGWGNPEQILDPVYASRVFYEALLDTPGWTAMDVTQAAQRVQRSGFPEAYADHEPEARLMAVAFLGQAPASLTCADLPLSGASDTVATLAATELGTARLSGDQPPEAGWAIASWLVAHAERLSVDKVTYDGRTWTASAGAWATAGPADGRLALHRVGTP